jgi:hypothetical protein
MSIEEKNIAAVDPGNSAAGNGTEMREERIDAEIERDLSEIAKDAREIECLEEEKRHLHHHPSFPDLVTIIIDGTPHEWPKGKITFAQVVTLEFPDYSEGGINYSVKYTKGPKENPEGILSPGASVEVKGGMNFHVSRTGQS